jgi:YihY family inner membrane protein
MNRKDFVERLLQRLNRLTGGGWAVLQFAFVQFGKSRAAEAAASMAYYAFFCLFPLLLFIVAAGSYVLEKAWVYKEIISFVQEFAPLFEPLITDTIGKVIDLRGPVGIIGLIGLLWSSSAFFAVLVRNIDRAWPGVKPRNFIQQRVFAIEMIASVTALLFLAWVLNAMVNLFPKVVGLPPPVGGYAILPRLAVWGATLLFSFILYTWVPPTKVNWVAAAIGAAIATLFLQLTSLGIGWFLGRGLLRYELIYGSLGTVALLMLWTYLAGWIILFGAHLSASLHRSIRIRTVVMRAFHDDIHHQNLQEIISDNRDT